MFKKLSASAVMFGLLGSASIANAVDEDLGIYGFLSVGATVLDNENENNDNGVTLDGFDDEAGNFKQDTVFGLQITKQINDKTSATGQLVSRGTSNYETESAWAFVSYAVNSETDVRMGRLRIPFFYYSEFLEVGYAYNWIRTPSDVYSIPFSSFDGLDITHRFSVGKMDGSIQANYGRFTETIDVFGSDYDADLQNILGVALTLNHGDFGLRLAAQQADITFDNMVDADVKLAYTDLIVATQTGDQAAIATAQAAVAVASEDVRGLDVALSAVDAYGAVTGNTNLSDEFDLDNKKANFYDAAFTYNNGNYGLVVEAIQIDYESGLLLDTQSYLVSGSKRFGDTTVHATYSTAKDELDSGVVGQGQELLQLEGEDISVILGARYDYAPGTAIKFEIENHDEKIHNAQDGNSAMLYSVAVDMIF
ncbi:MAG: hypothetical protein V7785_07235 [Bermanella sp.]